MKPAFRNYRERGSAAIEFALVFLAVWVVVMVCWVAGNMALQRSLIKQAARDAALMVANANVVEMTTTGAASDVEDRAEAALREAIERGGNEVTYVDFTRRVLGGYSPALRFVQVTVDADVTESVFPTLLDYGRHTVTITVEVPYGGRVPGA